MLRTPLLRPLRDDGATLYVFPSASEDIGLNLNSRATGAAMSHYALLNLPNLMGLSTALKEAEAIATDLQNYVMNFETTLLNLNEYNYLEYHTVSERVFWHWLIKKLGKIKLEDSLNGNFSSFYKTEKFNKNKVVLCFGSIDAGNSLSTEFGMFNETYVNIPSSYGNGPVFFKQVLDPSETNYVLGRKYIISKNTDKLLGRGDNVDSIKILNDSTPIYDTGTTYEASDAFEIVKDIQQIQTALREFTKNDNIIINSYDDVNIDNNNQFKDSVFDITSLPNEFGFNAILLYYSVYDQEDTTKSAYAINLFGIVFLDSPVQVGTESTSTVIECLNKKKSYSGSNAANFFGNSYSFRVNIKTMSVYDNTDAIILDNTTMSSISSVDFSDVVSNLNRAIDVMNTNVQTTMAILDQYMNILKYYYEQKGNIDDISTKVDGFINGSKTSTLNLNLLRTNEVRAENSEKNMIKFTLNRRLTDYIDNSNYVGTTYIPPIVITNDYDTFNIPAVFKPVLDVNSTAETALGTWTDSLNGISDIIESIDIKYYWYNGKAYPSILLPESLLNGNGLDTILYRSGNQLDPNDKEIENITFINYEALMPLIITYIQSLKNEIEALKNKV